MINQAGVILTPHDSDEQPEQRGADADLPDRPRVADVARWLGLHENTIYGLIHRGEIPYKLVGKRTYIFDKAALLEWAKPEQEAVKNLKAAVKQESLFAA